MNKIGIGQIPLSPPLIPLVQSGRTDRRGDFCLAPSLVKRAGEICGSEFEMIPYDKRLKKYARDLRCNMTKEECIVWKHIKNKQILDVQFYRQKPIGNFIVDFYAPKPKLIIEIDGMQHFEADNYAYDMERSLFFQQYDLNVVRFTNNEVLYSLKYVLARLYSIIEKRCVH
ncbi:MAG: endonuclease domain-containing protein [Mariprofundales bacterium]